VDIWSTEQMQDMLIASNQWIDDIADISKTATLRSDESMILNFMRDAFVAQDRVLLESRQAASGIG
jgi:hypothetical protein